MDPDVVSLFDFLNLERGAQERTSLDIPSKLMNSMAVKLRMRSTTSDDVIISKNVTNNP
jgi:hypothetical protein